MIFSAEDGRFGLIVAHVPPGQMFKLRLIVGGQIMGADEPCFIASAMLGLGDLARLDDQYLRMVAKDPRAAISTLDHDESIHDLALLDLPESFDDCYVRGYRFDGSVAVVAYNFSLRDKLTRDAVNVSVLNEDEYSDIIRMARYYWQSKGGS